MTSRRCIYSMTAALAILAAACSSSDGSGGALGTGGRTASGGSQQPPGSGGSGPSNGGSAGGARASGGAAVGGSQTGAGGAAAGGKPGAGGTTTQPGTGGTAASGGTPGKDAGPAAGGVGGGASGSGGTTVRDGGTGGTPATGGSSGGVDSGTPGGAVPSAGCGKTPTLKNGNINIDSGGASRMYVLKLPSNYDNNHPYRLILSYHGANGHATDIASGGFFGLSSLSNNSTIFIAPDGVNTQWAAPRDTTFTSDILKQVEADLCIDTTRIQLEGFSMGAAMVWSIACNIKGTFRAAVGHSGGGVAAPTSCDPIAYMGSGGTQESGGSQAGQSDKFAKWDGCTITSFPNPPTGGHICSDYTGCSAGHPVRWCLFDAGHMPDPKDSGKSSSWMPADVWAFFSQF